MEQPNLHIFYIDEDKKGRLKYGNAFLYLGIPVTIWMIFDLLLAWKFDGLYLGLALVACADAFNSKSRQIDNLRLEIGS